MLPAPAISRCRTADAGLTLSHNRGSAKRRISDEATDPGTRSDDGIGVGRMAVNTKFIA